MMDYRKIFIGIEFGKKDVWRGNIRHCNKGLFTVKPLSKTYPLLKMLWGFHLISFTERAI